MLHKFYKNIKAFTISIEKIAWTIGTMILMYVVYQGILNLYKA